VQARTSIPNKIVAATDYLAAALHGPAAAWWPLTL